MDISVPQSIVDALPYPAMIVTHNYHIEVANQSAQKMFDLPLQGNDFIRVMRHPDGLTCLNKAIAKQRRESCDLTISLNTDRAFEMSCAPLAPQQLILITLLDVTAEIEAERARSTFVANVSHELRSPLTAIMGAVETLRGPARDDDKARDYFLSLMETETQRMSRLVGDLLSLAKLEAKEHVSPEGDVNILSVLSGVDGSLSASQLDYSGRLVIRSEGDIPNVTANQDELTEVFQNLLENALKYSWPNTPVQVSVTAPPPRNESNSRRVIVTIIDQGEGINPKHIPRLTERFYRVDKGRSRLTGGTGLGLAITKHILNRHRARFHIRSEVGVGTKIIVSLPV